MTKKVVSNIIEKTIILFIYIAVLIFPLYAGLYYKFHIEKILIFILLIVLLYLINLFLKNKKIILNRLHILLLVIPFFYLLPIIFRTNLSILTIKCFFLYLGYSILIIIIDSIMNDKRKKALLLFIILSGIITFLVSTSSLFFTDFFKSIGIRSIYSDFYPQSVNRLYGTFLYPNSLSVFISIIYFVSLYLLFSEKKLIVKIISLIGVFVGVVTLGLTLSKMVIFIFIISNILILLIYLKKDKEKFYLLLSIWLSIIVPALILINNFRTSLFSNNYLKFVLIIIYCLSLFLIIHLITRMLLKKNKKIFMISSVVYFGVIIVFIINPISKPLRITNDGIEKDIIIFDMMNLESSGKYKITLDVTSNGSIGPKTFINLEKMYLLNNQVGTKSINTYDLDKKHNHVEMTFEAIQLYEYYYLEFSNIINGGIYELNNLKLENVTTGETINYGLDYYVLPYTIAHQIEGIKYDIGSINGRKQIYDDCFDIAKGHFLIGQGAGTFEHYSLKYAYSHDSLEEHSHILKLLLETGIFGAIYYIFIFVFGIITILRVIKSKKVLVFGGLFIFLFLNSIFDLNMSYSINYLLYLLFLSYIYNEYKIAKKNRVMFISSAGGHLTELLKLDRLFNNYDYVLITEKNYISKRLKLKYRISFLIYCSRFYPIKYILITPINILLSAFYFLRYNPDVIYTTGAHTSVFMCYLGWLFDRKIIFVEVYDRSITPTLSGKLIHHVANTFIVQHDTLKIKYKKAKYFGGVY